jgi:hypothetical protein
MPSPKERTYRPDLLSRRNEVIAWGLFALALLGGLISTWYVQSVGGELPTWVYAGVGVVFVVAAGFSLGNWMDRRTVLKLADEGLEFSNGLRHVKVGWRDVSSLEVKRSPMGDAVRVTGPRSRFSFTVSGGMRFGGKRRSRFGFSNGEEIIKEIVKRSGLSLTGQNASGYYYARS